MASPFFTVRSLTPASLVAISLLCAAPATTAAQPATQSSSANATAATPASAARPSDYRIGVEDVLSVVFWREKDMSAEVVVRPDGKISLPMLNDVPAAGLTPEQLADVVAKAGTKFVRDAGATVIVKEIRSRKIYIIGEVSRPGTIQLGSEKIGRASCRA